VIPDAAVEAAAKALYELQVGQAWGDKPEYTAVWDAYARAALESAAPHMLAGARSEAWEEGVAYALPGTKRGLATFEEMRPANPYR